MNTQNSTTSQQQDEKYNNLHTSGIGYVNRIREVRPAKGPAFLACTVAALVGKPSDKEKRYIDVRVSGKEAQHLLMRCQEASEQKRSIFISFVIGDIYADSFTYGHGHEKAGQIGITMKGRLLLIKSIHIDGELVWTRTNPSESPVIEEGSDGFDAQVQNESNEVISCTELHVPMGALQQTNQTLTAVSNSF